MQLYLWKGNLATWNTPAITGHYEVRTFRAFNIHPHSMVHKYLVPGLIPPLLATVGINGKVSFLEKGGTSEFKNSTGAYELDLSLVNDFSHAWREMHVKTDVFCSGAVVLPDKAARILNVGGWSLTSTFGVRLYAPDGAPGVTSVNDWEEDPNTLKLQVRLSDRSLHCAYRSSTCSSYRVAVGTQPHLLCPMAASSLSVVRRAQTPRPTLRLRFFLVFLEAIHRSSLTGSSGRTKKISIHSCMFSRVVTSLLVSSKLIDLQNCLC